MLSHGARLPAVRKIAVLRANGIGDFIFALPALEALRAAYPHTEITLLGQAWHAGLLNGRPGPVDRVIVTPPSRGVNEGPDGPPVEDPAELERFFAAMRRERFDLALQLHGGGRYSNPFVLRLGARLTAGTRTPDAAQLDRWIPYVYFQNETLRWLEVVALVGAPPVGLEPRLWLTEADHAEVRAALPEDGSMLVALHPGAGAAMRRWPVERFAQLGDALAAQGATVVVTGARADEQPLVAGVVAAMRYPAHNLWGRLSLGGLAALFACSHVVISNDSGPLHLAITVGAPTVGIYWGPNVINAAPATRARHRPVIGWRLSCPHCGRHRLHAACDHDVSFVAEVPVAEVLAAARELLETARLRAPAQSAGQERG